MSDLPPLSLSDVEACITHQLEAHGLTGDARDRAHAAARNVAAALWLHYQDALSGRTQARAELARRRGLDPEAFAGGLEP